jgi:hypothetical protein
MLQDFLDLQHDEPLLPAGMHEWLPEDDLTFAVLDAVATLGLASSAVGTGQLRCSRRWPRSRTGTEARLHYMKFAEVTSLSRRSSGRCGGRLSSAYFLPARCLWTAGGSKRLLAVRTVRQRSRGWQDPSSVTAVVIVPCDEFWGSSVKAR